MKNFKLHQKIMYAFDELLSKNLQSDLNNEIVAVRNNICQLLEFSEAEDKAERIYGKRIDLLNYSPKELDLHSTDSPYWLNGVINEHRPPGPNNSEITALINAVHEMTREFLIIRASSGSVTISQMEFNKLIYEITELIRETFVLPNSNIPFTNQLYDRSPNAPFAYSQNTPCEICGENRSIDVCHIIPAKLRGPKLPHNTIYLCPTHHRLFDRFLLSPDEFGKIQWQNKSKASSTFAYHVLRPFFEKNWAKHLRGDYKTSSDHVFAFNGSEAFLIYQNVIAEFLKPLETSTVEEIADRLEIEKEIVIEVINEFKKNGKVISEGSAVKIISR